MEGIKHGTPPLPRDRTAAGYLGVPLGHSRGHADEGTLTRKTKHWMEGDL